MRSRPGDSVVKRVLYDTPPIFEQKGFNSFWNDVTGGLVWVSRYSFLGRIR